MQRSSSRKCTFSFSDLTVCLYNPCTILLLLFSALQDCSEYCQSQPYDTILELSLRSLDFCYSSVVKVFLGYFQDFSRPVIELCMGRQAWQVTSLKMMVGMSRNIKVIPEPTVTSEDTIPQAAAGVESTPNESSSSSELASNTPLYCRHKDTRNDEEHFFAPTGNGSIVTKVICNSCGEVLSTSSEYFD